MAGLQHGLATVGTYGEATDNLLSAENGRSLLLADAKSTDAYAQCVRKLLADTDLRDQLGTNAKLFFDRHFSWNRIADRLLGALRDVDARPSESRVSATVATIE